MKSVLLVDIVGLTPRLLSERTPNLLALGKSGAMAPMTTVLPAVTCSAQATMLTGLAPSGPGALGHGWVDPARGEGAPSGPANPPADGAAAHPAPKPLDPT